MPMRPLLLRNNAFFASEGAAFDVKSPLFQPILNGDANTSISVEKFLDFSQRIKQEKARRWERMEKDHFSGRK